MALAVDILDDSSSVYDGLESHRRAGASDGVQRLRARNVFM